MSEEKNEGLRVLKAEIKNFKNIDYKEVDLNGRSLFIVGPNAVGKSSLIQAILSPVDSQYIPLEPIKEGEQRGSAKITIGGNIDGDPVKYTVACHFSQEHKRGVLTLTDSDGNDHKQGARNILDGIIGDISFNIMDFIKLGQTKMGKVSKEGVREQIEILKGLMSDDVIKSIAKLDEEKAKIYEQRTDINRETKFMSSQIEKNGFTQEEIDKYSEPLDVKELSDKITAAKEKNININRSKEFIQNFPEKEKNLDEHIAEAEKVLADLRKQKEDEFEQKAKCELYLKKNPKLIDVDVLTVQLENLSDHNTKHLQVKEMDAIVIKKAEEEKKALAISDRLKAIDEEKKTLFANAKMPVKGLAFDEENVTFRDLPLSEGNIPTSQLIGIGLKIGMALNPNLRLLVIRDGSLLDDKTMKFILKTCEEKGYQLLIEVVKHEGGELSLEFIEK